MILCIYNTKALNKRHTDKGPLTLIALSSNFVDDNEKMETSANISNTDKKI